MKDRVTMISPSGEEEQIKIMHVPARQYQGWKVKPGEELPAKPVPEDKGGTSRRKK